MNENMKAVGEELLNNKELCKELENLWQQGASAEQLAQTAQAAGVSLNAEDLEAALAKAQAKKEEMLELVELDDGLLEQVAGGFIGKHCSGQANIHAGDGICVGPADCDEDFKDCQSTLYTNRCEYFSECDEAFG